MGAGNGLNTAMIVVAAVDIPAGREVRWDYDNSLVGQTVPSGHASAGDTGRRARLTRLCHGSRVVWTIADDAMAQGALL